MSHAISITMTGDLHKFPRLYLTADLSSGAFPLCAEHAHYLRNVLRKRDGDTVRFFNGRDGEWLGKLVFDGKKGVLAQVDTQVKPQPARKHRLHLFFAPLKKERLDVLIEKAVELDATDLHPVITDRTEVREVKPDKLNLQIIEAAEQCERLDVPTLHAIEKLDKKISGWQGAPIFSGIERSDAKLLRDALVPVGDVAALVGPVGGWTDAEREMLGTTSKIIPVSLGTNVLRSETAVAVMLARLAR